MSSDKCIVMLQIPLCMPVYHGPPDLPTCSTHCVSYPYRLELASFFVQLRAAIDVSRYRPSFCFSRVWLRFLPFSSSASACLCPRLESWLPPSAKLPTVIVPTLSASECSGKSRPFAAARQSRTTPSAEC